MRNRLQDEEADKNVGRVIQVLAAARGVPLKDIAAHLGMHANGLSDRMAGRRQWRVAELIALAGYLKVEPGVFFRPVLELVPATESSALSRTCLTTTERGRRGGGQVFVPMSEAA